MKDLEKGKEKIRFFEIFHSQIYKNYPLNEPIKNAYELNTFVVEVFFFFSSFSIFLSQNSI